MTRETVAVDTPASRATSYSVHADPRPDPADRPAPVITIGLPSLGARPARAVDTFELNERLPGQSKARRVPLAAKDRRLFGKVRSRVAAGQPEGSSRASFIRAGRTPQCDRLGASAHWLMPAAETRGHAESPSSRRCTRAMPGRSSGPD